MDSLEQNPTIIFANEFFDALTIKQYQIFNDNLKERVIKHDKVFRFDLAETNSLIDSEAYKNGDIIERSESSVAIMQHLAKLIKRNRGVFITFDYGYWGQGSINTLQAVKNHKFSNLFEDLGRSDLTSQVNFKNLVDAAAKEGIENFNFMTQAEFLESMGINLIAKKLSKLNPYSDFNEELGRLLGKKQMGELFKCLIFENM